MYPDYPLQICLTLNDGRSRGTAHATNRDLTAETAEERDVLRLLASVRIMPVADARPPRLILRPSRQIGLAYVTGASSVT
jgi:hypothetical protein